MKNKSNKNMNFMCLVIKYYDYNKISTYLTRSIEKYINIFIEKDQSLNIISFNIRSANKHFEKFCIILNI